MWFNKEHRTVFDDAEDLAHSPSGGRLKQWLAGVLLAGWPIGYGILSLSRGKTVLLGKSFNEMLTGDAAISLAIAYIAIGCFIHFHYFWGLSEVLWPFSQTLKLVSLVIAAPAFIYALWRALGW